MALISTLTPDIAKSQQWQHILNVDTRSGYTTNTYLNPFIGEWDRSGSAAYSAFSVIDHSLWSERRHSISLTGGLVYEPFFSNREAWKGGLGIARYIYRFSGSVHTSIEAGTSYYSSSFNRTSSWVQPAVTWFISPFTSVRLKTGSNFRYYGNLESIDSNQRFDLYAVEFETWPSYRLQLSAGLYGGLDTIPDIGNGFNSVFSVQYSFANGGRIGLRAGLEQYRYAYQVNSSGSGLSPGVAEEMTTNQIFRAGLRGLLPVNGLVTLTGSVDYLAFDPRNGQESPAADVHISAGVRLSLEPKFKKESNRIEPEWEGENENYLVRIRYSGTGKLYLVGDFNNWNRPGIPMTGQSAHEHIARLELSTGAYEYKVLKVQGGSEQWLIFSDDTYTVEDGFGGENALVLVD